MSEEQDHNDEPQEESLRDTLEAAIADTEESEAPAPDDAPVVEEPAAEAEAPSEGTEVSQPEVQSAPVGWEADLRESWAGLPENVRDKVLAREKEIEHTLQNASGARRKAEQMDRLFGTYGAVLNAEGAQDPLQATQALFQTVSELRMGSPAQRAQKMAQLIKHYGIDISQLDSALVGEKVEDTPATQEQIQQAVQQQLQPWMQQQQYAQEQQRVQMQMSANNEVAVFAKDHEFLNDVRYQMADLMDGAAKQGRELSMEDAYNMACQLNPHVQKVMEGRKLTQSSQATQAKVNAASSVAGSGQMASTGSGDSMRDALLDAWDAQSN